MLQLITLISSLLQIEKMSLTVEASKLLDFNQKLDIPLLDNVIGFMYNGIGEQVRIIHWSV